MRLVRTCLVAGGTVVSFASTTLAQSDIAPRTAVDLLLGGAGSTSSRTVWLSWVLLFDTERPHISGGPRGTQPDSRGRTVAVSVSGSLLINLLPAPMRIVPYAAVGGGVYRTSLDWRTPRCSVLSARDSALAASSAGARHRRGAWPWDRIRTRHWHVPGSGSRVLGRGSDAWLLCPTFGPDGRPRGRGWDTRSFTDPAISVGVGVRFNVSDHLMVRPDIRAFVVFAEGDTHRSACSGCSSDIDSDYSAEIKEEHAMTSSL